MARHIQLLSTIVGLVLIALGASCRNDFEFVPSSGQLAFSKDTVFLDTVFTNIGSSTYTLKVYNRSQQDILIPYVGLETGQNSSYRLNVDGMAGKEFNNVPLLAKDSLFVFIETTFDITQTTLNEFLYTEGLLFGNGGSTQRVELVTLVKDAVFLYPATRSDGTKETLVLGQDDAGNDITVEGFFLEPDQLDFTNEKPYVIYGYAAVPDGNVLTVQPGARVHFHNRSGILVNEGATLHINGALSEDPTALENEVIFEGDRLEPGYADVPGQWGTLWIREGSTGNSIDHLTLKNATVGLRVEGDGILDTPTLHVRNTQIYNSQEHNLWATAAHIQAQNTVLGGAGSSSLYIDLGGQYRFVHSTLANYWNHGFRSGTTLSLANFANGMAKDLQQADFINCIVAGSLSLELALLQDSSVDFNFGFDHCLLQFNDNNDQFGENPLYNFGNTDLYRNIVLNQEPNFFNPSKNQLTIHDNSAAIDKGDPDASLSVPADILGMDRTQNPDLGAYEFTDNN
ncbi:choice-of-anchor Q domain-containing protein [Flagellimonas sp.]|uniref:choice-of-anchor Q domain-containing protein n=1 Tax=Flagellimonas sp. TaxID=2058762 RepID=UPI003BA871F0